MAEEHGSGGEEDFAQGEEDYDDDGEHEVDYLKQHILNNGGQQ